MEQYKTTQGKFLGTLKWDKKKSQAEGVTAAEQGGAGKGRAGEQQDEVKAQEGGLDEQVRVRASGGSAAVDASEEGEGEIPMTDIPPPLRKKKFGLGSLSRTFASVMSLKKTKNKSPSSSSSSSSSSSAPMSTPTADDSSLGRPVLDTNLGKPIRVKSSMQQALPHDTSGSGKAARQEAEEALLASLCIFCME